MSKGEKLVTIDLKTIGKRGRVTLPILSVNNYGVVGLRKGLAQRMKIKAGDGLGFAKDATNNIYIFKSKDGETIKSNKRGILYFCSKSVMVLLKKANPAKNPRFEIGTAAVKHEHSEAYRLTPIKKV